jgi:hypothetical protein
VKGVRSTHEFLSFPREEMARELPRNPGLFVLVEKWREWSRRQILGREEAQAVLRNLKKLSGAGLTRLQRAFRGL